MNYQIKTSSGDKYVIEEQEAKNLAGGETKGLVFIPSLKGFINLSFVVSVVPEDKVDKTNIKEGYLHDGTRVIKKFGQWVDANNPNVHLDPSYYPELASDEIFSQPPLKQLTPLSEPYV